MPATVSHQLSATTPDDPSFEIQPKHWNSGHAVSLSVEATEISGLFSNANGVSWGTTDGKITATVKTDYQTSGAYLTTAALSNHSHGNPTLHLTNLSGTTDSNSAGFTLSLSAAAAGAANINFSAGTTSGNLGSVVFSNSNGVSFGLDGSTITATVATNYLTSQSNQAVSAANGSYAFQTLSFSNANGVSFGTSAGSAITASHNAITTARASNDAVGLNTAQTNVTWTVNSSGLSFDAAGYAGTGTSATNASITLNSNGLAISVAAPGGGAAATDNLWFPWAQAQNVVGQQGQGTFHIAPVDRFNRVEFDRLVFPVNWSHATNSTGRVTLSQWFGIYTKNVSSLSLLHSTSLTTATTFSGTANSASLVGVRLVTLPWTTTVTEGQYWVGIGSSTSSSSANGSFSQVLMSQLASAVSGNWGAGSATSAQWPLGFGALASTTNAVPASIAFSQIRGTGTLDARPPSWFAVSGTA